MATATATGGIEESGQVLAPNAMTPAWYSLIDVPQRTSAVLCRKPQVGIQAGRGGGKTEVACRKLVAHLGWARPWRDPRYFFAADTVGKAQSIAWEKTLALIPSWWMATGWPKESKDSLEIRTIFGSSLRFFGLHAPKCIEGKQYDGGVVDESSDIERGAFNVSIMPALLWRKGWCWRMGVPKRNGIGSAEFNEWFNEGLAGLHPDRACFRWTSADVMNSVDPARLATLQRSMDPKDYHEQMEAVQETAGGRVFYAFDENINCRPCAYRPERILSITCDFNVDPMCWLIGHRYENRIEWIDEIFLRDTNTTATLKVLWERWGHHTGGFEFFGDPASRARKTSASFTDYALIVGDKRFWTDGRPKVYIPIAHPPIADRFAACNAMLCNAAGQRRMFLSRELKRLKDDLKARHYKPGTNEPEDSGDLGHMTDAMGYLVWACFPIRIEMAPATGAAGFVGFNR